MFFVDVCYVGLVILLMTFSGLCLIMVLLWFVLPGFRW